MLDKEMYLIVSEHGFLLQMEKGGISKCEKYIESYNCSLQKGLILKLDDLPKKCPMVEGSDPTKICPIIWLLTCQKEQMVKKDDVQLIMKGEFDDNSVVTDHSLEDEQDGDYFDSVISLGMKDEEINSKERYLTELDAKIEERKALYESIKMTDSKVDGSAMVDIKEKERSLEMKEKQLTKRENALKVGEKELEDKREEVNEQSDKAIKLLELVKKKDAKVRKKIQDMNRISKNE